jgi:hypothetical protein
MPIVHECASEDCKVLTIGEFCLDHERRDEQLESALTASVVTLARKTDTPERPCRLRRPRKPGADLSAGLPVRHGGLEPAGVVKGRGGGELLIARSPRNLSAHPDGARLDRSAEFQTEEGLE